jgi:hypothetical protein
MRKLLLLFLLGALPAFGQGQIPSGCLGNTVTGTAWNNTTTNNSTQSLAAGIVGDHIIVLLHQTTTITVGAINFQIDYGNGTLVNAEAWRVVDPTSVSYPTISLPYTLQASTDKPFIIQTHGVVAVWLKLTTAITGSGAITPYTTVVCTPLPLAYQATATNQAVSATFPSTQSVNEAQINGVTPLMNNGVSGTGSQRVNIASDNTPFENYPVTTATTTDTLSTCYLTSAATTNSTNCKGSAGNVYGILVSNTTSTIYYLRMYNSASAPTCSSATNFIESIPALATSANGFAGIPEGFSTGISFCLTGGGSSTDNTNAATGVYVTILYK